MSVGGNRGIAFMFGVLSAILLIVAAAADFIGGFVLLAFGLGGHALGAWGRSVLDLVKECLALSRQGLRRRERLDQNGLDETRYLASVQQFVDAGITPAEQLLDKFHGPWGGSVDPLFTEYAY